MSATPSPQLHLRVERSELERLAGAFAISLAVHLSVFGLYQLEVKYHWIEALRLPDWLQKAQQALAELRGAKKSPPPIEREVPLMFVEVNPEQAVTEAPKDSKYYSDKSSRAANPDTDLDSDAPKITGKQSHVPKAEDVPRTKAFPLQPAFPAQPNPQPEEEAKPKATQPPGDLAFAKPEQSLRKDDGQAKQSKPRTVQEALALPQNQRIPGEKVKQEGGVKLRATVAFDVKGTPFGAYDAALINAVTHRWYDLLDSGNFARDRRGKVVLQFHLNFDGRITDLNVLENSVGELLGLLCQKAVLDPAPFANWPSDIRRMVGADYREVTFTFFYD